MAKLQLHKRLSNDHVRFILGKYLAKEIKAKFAIEKLKIGKTRFYQLVHAYQKDPLNFNISYEREKPTRTIASEIEQNILKELEFEKVKIISNPDVPTKRYNYSYIKNLLLEKHDQTVSLDTVINRAKEHGYYLPKRKKKVHDREVVTNYVGELVQHDSSHHLFAPDSGTKWYLITSIDDYSRKILYADFWLTETSFLHILALQNVILNYGIPFAYYTDQHRIFRYVKDRDKNSPWVNYTKFTDDVDPQWKKVLKILNIEPIAALSPQAKGKIERPYGWLQDHLIRTFVRENVTDINEGRKYLKQEINDYNGKRIHSTVQEIPNIRFRNAIKQDMSLFSEFNLEPPFESVKDIFCLRIIRTPDAYRKISFDNKTFKIAKAQPKHDVELRIYPDVKTGIVEIRFWDVLSNTFLGSQRLKAEELPIVHF